uniref:ABC transporter domain-containing protein n=1 Tax=Ascaris lumbricoides TaxID=6252 RepID=A0A0M3HNM0_ASCLU
MGLQKKKAAEYAQICGIKPNMSEISFDEDRCGEQVGVGHTQLAAVASGARLTPVIIDEVGRQPRRGNRLHSLTSLPSSACF